MQENRNGSHEDAREEIRRLIEEVAQTPLIQTRDIPKVDLYMEQVVSFFDQGTRRTRYSPIP